jgi:hypothetical protein
MPGRIRRALFPLGLAVLAATSAGAHTDPPGCFETGPAIVIAVFRADGVTGVVGSISECETIFYRATLQKASNGTTICAFSEGTFRLTTPDGVVHDIELDVPCIGGTGGEGCDPTVTQLQSALIPYAVSPADVVGGLVTANAEYAGGITHDSAGNTAGVGAETPKSTPVTFCADADPCTDDVCDPEATGPQACSTTPIECDDGSVCTTEVCVDGACVFAPIDCADQDGCTRDFCDPVLGCRHVPEDCEDRDLCTIDSCDPVLGCRHVPVGCDDGDPCTDDSCHPTLGCQNLPNLNPACPGLNHFQCYEIKPFAFPDASVTVQDRYGTVTETVRSPNRLCAPSDKRGEDPTAATDSEHLTGFPTRAESVRVVAQTVTNQFGSVTLDLRRRPFLFVPTAKSLQGPPGPLADPETDHFQCYGVRRSRGTPRFEQIRDVPATDQFGPHVLDVVRPRYLCVPANKNGEDPDALSSTRNLLCYKARHREAFPTLAPFIDNQLVSTGVTIIRRMEFCVPSIVR